VTDPRIPEARRAVARYDAQLAHLNARADLATIRPIAAKRDALARFLNGQGVATPPPPVTW
jgi:hypothetical protein